MFFQSEEKAQEYRDYVQRNGLQSAATVARETRPEAPVQTPAPVQTSTPVQPVNQYQSYSNLRYPQSETSNEAKRNKWGDEIQ